jgi:hypothetical protein
MRSCALQKLLIAVHLLSAPSSDAVDYAKFYSRSHDAVIRVYDESGNVIETH